MRGLLCFSVVVSRVFVVACIRNQREEFVSLTFWYLFLFWFFSSFFLFVWFFIRRAKLYRNSHLSQSTGIPTPLLDKFELGLAKPSEKQIDLIERIVGVPLVKRRPTSLRRI